MKKLYYTLLFILFIPFLGMRVHAQGCQPIVPVFNVDLTGQPNATWISPPTNRNGYCCSASGADNCVDFNITLDTAANGIAFNIASGAIPPGALYYQINCGPPVPVGNIICLTGPGPYMLTFCKPGGNTNTFSITSIPAPAANGTPWVSNACTGMMAISGVTPSSVTWSSIPYNATYNSYLSCTTGCDTVIVTPTGSFPPYVDYQVCGTVIGGCSIGSFCDTIRIHFVNNLAVNITPQNPTICYGSGFATVTANPVGGNPAYTYSWSTGATTQSINVGPGTYTVQMTDSMNCMTATDVVTVNGYAVPISANAGVDQTLCSWPTAQLNGTIVAAGGGQWFGGSGTYSPNDTTMNAVYTPSASEIAAGFAHLYLVTTHNLGCLPDTDDVMITISPNPTPIISGTNPLCVGQTTVYTTPFVAGNTYVWNVTGGTIITSSANSVTVHWPSPGGGTITVTETNAATCDSTVTYNVTIAPQPAPSITGVAAVCTGTTTTYSITSPTPGDVFAWTVSGGTIVGSSSGTSITVQWTSAGSATVSVNESNSAGCNATGTINVNVLLTPSPVISGLTPVCAGQTTVYTTPLVAGNNYAWSVTGGTVISTSSNSVTVHWPLAGNGTVTVTENNTATCDSTVSINILIAPQPAPSITGVSAVCTGTSTVYSVSPATPGNTYAWTVSGGTIVGSSSGTSVNIQWSSAGSATISVHESNSSGCNATATFNVNVLLTPAPVISGTTPVCAGQTTVYTTPFVAGNTYSWSVTGGTIISTSSNSVTVHWPVAGNGTVTVTENNTATCDSTVSMNILVAPQPAPSITGVSAVCTGTSTAYSISPVTSGNTYAWTVSGGSIIGSSTGSSITVQWSTAGSATISVHESNSSGCNATATINVNVLQMPAPVISGTTPVCAGQTMTYTTPYVPGNNYSWNVTGGTIVSASTNNITINWPASGNGTLTVTENNTATCDSAVTLNVLVAPQPAPVITGANAVCTGTSTIYSVATPTVGNTYSWSVTGGIITGVSNGTSVNIQWNVAGTATITLYESNSYGCDSTVTMTVNVLQTPAPNITGTTPVCAGQTVTYTTPYVTGNTYSWNVTGGNTVSTNNNSITVYWPTAGNGTLTIVENNTSTCSANDNLNVLIAPQPAPVIAGPPTVCTGTSSTFNVTTPTTGNTYYWNVTGGMIVGSSNSTSLNVQWTTSGTATISLYESNSYGCDSTVSINVNVLQTPSPVITGTTPVCAGQTMTYTTPYVTGNTYSWNVTGGNEVSTNNNTVTIAWPTAGNGTITITENNTATCPATVNMNVVIAPQPAPVITGTAAVCTGTSSSYTITNPVSGNSYAWTVSGGAIIGSSTSALINVQWSNPGTATISVHESNGYGCDSTVTFTVNVLQMPSPSITGSNHICGGSTDIYSTSLVNGNTYNWTVNGGTVVSTSNNTITVMWPNAGAGSVTVTESNTSACSVSVTYNVNVGAQPSPVINGSTGICWDANGTYSVATPVSGDYYSWSVSGGNIIGSSNGSSINVHWTTAGAGTVMLTESNAFGCDSTIIINVTVNPQPTPHLTGTPRTCVQLTQEYSVDDVQGDSYTWSVSNGSIVGFAIGHSIQVYWGNAGQGYVSCRQMNPTGCDSTVAMGVQIDPLPIAAINGPHAICENEAALYSVTASNGSTYSWSVTGGNATSNTSGSSVGVNWASTSGSITLSQTDINGCSNQNTIPVVVNAKPHPAITGNAVGCISSSLNQYITASLSSYAYNWAVSGGTITSGNGTNHISVHWSTPGTDTITLRVTNTSTGCDSTVAIPITVGSMPTPSILANGFAGCAPLGVSFLSSLSDTAYHYSWTFGDGHSSTSMTPSNDYINPGNYTVRLIVTNHTGCADTVTAPVNAYALPTAGFSLSYNDEFYYANQTQLALTNSSAGAVYYVWDFGNGDTSMSFQPNYQYMAGGTYTITLTAVSQHGCRDVTTFPLEVRLPENIFVPNAFTPNDDNSNDYFSIQALNITDFHVKIFNRWGGMIYQSDDPAFKWDGKMNGNVVQEGVYVYQIRATGYKGKPFDLIGSVTVAK